jgi:hypothetical protein
MQNLRAKVATWIEMNKYLYCCNFNKNDCFDSVKMREEINRLFDFDFYCKRENLLIIIATPLIAVLSSGFSVNLFNFNLITFLRCAVFTYLLTVI